MSLFRISSRCLGIFVMLMGSTASATDPGTPMDCTDLVLSPGLSCTPLSNPGQGFVFRNVEAVVDNDGRIYTENAGAISDILRELGFCGTRKIVELSLIDHIGVGGTKTSIASVNERCLNPATNTSEGLRLSSLMFDPVRGDLIVLLTSTCGPDAATCQNYNGGNWMARISGFTPLADVLPKPPLPLALCKNGIDDDGDGAIDMDDDQCKSPNDNDESRP